MSKPTLADLATLLTELKQSTERASAALDATLRSMDEREASRADRDKAVRARALAEFDGLDLGAIAEALNLTDGINESLRKMKKDRTR